MKTVLALLLILAAAAPAAATGLIDRAVGGPPAGDEVCVNLKRELALCPIPGYQPPPNPLFAAPPVSHLPPPSIEEMRHQELIDAIKQLDRDLGR